MEQTVEISKILDYNLPIDYCTYYSKLLSLNIKPNLFKVNGNEKMIRYLYSMDNDSKISIMKFQNIYSQYKNKLVPFAELEFVDNLCFNKDDNSIVYYKHEEDTIIELADTWDTFQNKLYEEVK